MSMMTDELISEIFDIIHRVKPDGVVDDCTLKITIECVDDADEPDNDAVEPAHSCCKDGVCGIKLPDEEAPKTSTYNEMKPPNTLDMAYEFCEWMFYSLDEFMSKYKFNTAEEVSAACGVPYWLVKAMLDGEVVKAAVNVTKQIERK